MANIIITGASSGIGFQTALTLAAEPGHRILALARSEHRLRLLTETAAVRKAPSPIVTKAFDIIHGNYADQLLPVVKDALDNRVDVLINNAGVLINKPFDETTRLDFTTMVEANFLGHVSMIQHTLPYMVAWSHIVNIGSMGGFQGSVKFPGLAAYSASKAALHTLTESLAFELASRVIRVNCLALGSAQTEMLSSAFPDYRSPVSAAEMGAYIAQFSLTGHRLYNGKTLPVAVTTP